MLCVGATIRRFIGMTPRDYNSWLTRPISLSQDRSSFLLQFPNRCVRRRSWNCSIKYIDIDQPSCFIRVNEYPESEALSLLRNQWLSPPA